MGKAEKTRKFIIEQVAPIFNKKGYAGTSLSDLTEATGLTKGSIYGNFRDKEEVAIAALEYNYQKLNGLLWKGTPYETNAIDKLLLLLKNANDNKELIIHSGGSVLINVGLGIDETAPNLKAKVMELIEKFKTRLIEIIEEGKQKKDIPETVSETLAIRIITAIEGAFTLAAINDNVNYVQYVIQGLEEELTKLKA